ncbi:MAG: thiamine pyrophosphate-dependent dehydrogenase E1 component subunit alpha [Actinomycetota bacterium]
MPTDQKESADAPFQLIAPDGTPNGTVDVGLSQDELRELLRLMILSRAIDRDCVALQRQGELTVYPAFLGQEAAQVGSAFALAPQDFVFPSFRELAAAIVRGVDVVEYLQYHRGTWHGGPYDPYEHGFAPICVPVATQIPHAVGYAMGLKLDGKAACSLAYFGEGSSSEGDFHEACNMAAVFEAPVVLFCQNNGWAISVPTSDQLAAPVYLRAEGYGFPGVRVDGNDVLAVLQVTREAAERARSGGGPTLIEAMTYRMDAHSTADDATRYRTQEAVDAWHELDPIERYSSYLQREGVANGAFRSACESEAALRVGEIRAAVIATPAPPEEDLFRYTYARER